jgi:hypothetical protein
MTTHVLVFSDSVEISKTWSRDGYRVVFTVLAGDILLFVSGARGSRSGGSTLSILRTKDSLVLKEFLDISLGFSISCVIDKVTYEELVETSSKGSAHGGSKPVDPVYRSQSLYQRRYTVCLR